MPLSNRSLGRHLIVCAIVVALCATAKAGAQPPQLLVTGAVADASDGTLTISGSNFGVGTGNFATRPFVTLDLVPLDIRAATDTVILAAAPSGSIPPGKYLLTVSRGPAAPDNASLEVAVGPKGTTLEPSVRSASGAGPSDATKVSAKPSAESLPPVAAGSAPAARVGDRLISVEDVDREWRQSNPSSYLQLVRELYEARRQVLNTMIADDLLAREAASRGITVEALLAQEIPQRVIAMPDSAVASLYLSLGDGARGATLEQMRPALRAWLATHSEPEVAKMSFVEELKNVSTRAEVLLDAPRVQVERSPQDIALGASQAPIELVAFGDFESAEYARFAEAFSRVHETFGDRIRIVFKNLPTLGPESAAAAEAALCANAQQKFWPYHDALVAPGALDTARINGAAASAGLNKSAFDQCVTRHEFHDAIPRAIDEAERYGIRASPSFLINGRLAPPPPPFLAPYDYFKLLIEEELARVARRP